jgi:hypothetical protein
METTMRMGPNVAVVHSCKRWDVVLSMYVVLRNRGTAEYVRTVRAEIIPGTEESVKLSAIDEQGRYVPPSE